MNTYIYKIGSSSKDVESDVNIAKTKLYISASLHVFLRSQFHSSFFYELPFKALSMLIGRGKMIVEFFSADMAVRVCR